MKDPLPSISTDQSPLAVVDAVRDHLSTTASRKFPSTPGPSQPPLSKVAVARRSPRPTPIESLLSDTARFVVAVEPVPRLSLIKVDSINLREALSPHPPLLVWRPVLPALAARLATAARPSAIAPDLAARKRAHPPTPGEDQTKRSHTPTDFDPDRICRLLPLQPTSLTLTPAHLCSTLS